MNRSVNQDVVLVDLYFFQLMTTAAWQTPASMRGKQLLQPPLYRTHTMTRVRLSLT